MTSKTENMIEKPSDKDAVKQFRAASASFRKKTTQSKADALAALKKIGVLTPSGRLSSKYKS